MKRITLLAVFGVLFATQAVAGPWIKSLSVAQKKAKDNNQLVFVDLFADWCGWCHRMEQEVFPTEAFQKATDDMVLLRLNTEDGGEGTKLAQEYQVTSLPTFLVLGPDMSVAGLIRGYAPSAEFVKSVQNARSQYGDFKKRVANEKTFVKDYTKRLDLAKEMVSRSMDVAGVDRLRKLVADPKCPASVRDEAYVQLATAHLLQRRYGEVVKTVNAFSRIQTKGEPYERSRMLLVNGYLELGNLMGAVNELRNFKKTFPKSSFIPEVDRMLASVERRLSQPQ